METNNKDEESPFDAVNKSTDKLLLKKARFSHVSKAFSNKDQVKIQKCCVKKLFC